MGTTLAVLATLIGVFLTPEGIVVGVDTAVSGPSAAFAKAQKYCQSGASSVAMLQGHYGVRPGVLLRPQVVEAFRATCEALRRSPSTHRLQAAALARSVGTAVERLLDTTAAAIPPDERHVASITVAGYERSAPQVVVFEVRARVGQRRPEIVTRRVEAGFERCTALFQGEVGVTRFLRSSRPGEAPADLEWSGDELRLLRQADGDCTGWSIPAAKALFRTAIDATMKYGAFYGVPSTAVGRPFDLVTIRPDAGLTIERID
jgi:hypothetical protein